MYHSPSVSSSLLCVVSELVHAVMSYTRLYLPGDNTVSLPEVIITNREQAPTVTSLFYGQVLKAAEVNFSGTGSKVPQDYSVVNSFLGVSLK